jgi:hypothetical protein
LIDRAAGVRRLQFEVEGLEKLIRSIVPDGNLQTEEPAMRQALEVDCIRRVRFSSSRMISRVLARATTCVRRAVHWKTRTYGETCTRR